VARVAAVHNALRDVDAATRYVAVSVDVGDSIDRAGMNAYAELDIGMPAEAAAEFEGAANRGFGVVKEDEGHAISGWESDELVFGLRASEFRSIADSFLQFGEEALLVVHGQGGVGDDIHEEDMSYLKAGCWAGLPQVHRTYLRLATNSAAY